VVESGSAQHYTVSVSLETVKQMSPFSYRRQLSHRMPYNI